MWPRSARSRRRSDAACSEQEEEVTPGLDLDDEDYEPADGIDFRLLDADADEDGMPVQDSGPIPGVAGPRPLDVARLQNVLADLIACRELLDSAMKEG